MRWYASLLNNHLLLDAAWVTVRVALASASVATVLGTLAALALTRYTRFRGRFLFSGMVFAPLVMPEVITGLSLLLLFVAVGLDRGFLTVTLAHITFSMCFVAVVVQSRLISFDRSLEEAAMDLGATPVKAFFQVTLPIILPAVVSGWMLAFTLSLDDLVIVGVMAAVLLAGAALLGSTVALGLVPAGSGNGLAAALGVPREPRAAVALALDARGDEHISFTEVLDVAPDDVAALIEHPKRVVGSGLDVTAGLELDALDDEGLRSVTATSEGSLYELRWEAKARASGVTSAPVVRCTNDVPSVGGP
jgi:ABC-type sulfate transport system permease component